ncbi:MAG: SUMF1/EgtB/PvdO family nonheme iron enzyme [Pseudomonadota bacterium]
MAAAVFITHSSRDYKQSRAVVDVLEKNGLSCWISERDIGAGDNYGDAIVDAIESAKVMVLVFSANANNSDEIKKEIALASQRKLTVVPIRIEDATPSKAFRYELVTRNWIDCFPDWNQGMQTLVRRVSSIIGDAKPLDDLPQPVPVPKPRIEPAWIAAAAAGIVVIAGGAAYSLRPQPAPVTITHNDDNGQIVPAASRPQQVADATGNKPAAGNDAATGDHPAAAPSPAAEVPAPKPTPIAQAAAPKPVSIAEADAPRPAPDTQAEAPKPAPDTQAAASQPTPVAQVITPKPAPIEQTAAPKPALAPAIPKKTQIAALGPVVPVQTIAPPVKPLPSKPAAPAISDKPPAYNAATPGGQIFRECKDCPQMVVVPRGTAILGSPAGEPGRQSNEAAPHSVTIDKPFAVGRYAVTFDDWAACVAGGGCNGYKPDDNGFGRGRRPVIFVSWNDANAYVNWLKHKTGQPYRLLSESEWEYAARGCTKADCPDTPFWFGDIAPDLANYDSRYSYEGSPKADHEVATVPVDQGKPNPFGLTNMLGNVQQWVDDCWNADLSAPSDGSALLTGDCGDRVIRGGSYSDKPDALRASARAWDAADDRESPNIGIRVGRTLAP